MEINYLFSRKRRQFGKPCAFIDIGPKLMVDIDEDPNKAKDYYTIPTVDREVDNSMRKCAHEINTESHPTENRGMRHTEGGWPASVDNYDDDSTARFRKKVEKDKGYINAVKSLADFVETFVMENNSIDVYEDYFAGEKIGKDQDFSLRNLSVFGDPAGDYRSVVDVSWTLDSSKFAAAYTLNPAKQVPLDARLDCFVWDAQNPVSPVCTLLPEIAICCVQCSPTDANMLVSGSVTGQVALWDIRSSGRSQKLSDVLESHKEAVTGIKWLRNNRGMTFFSSSSDGQLITWDARKLSSPLEVVTVSNDSEPGTDLCYNVSCAEYDETVPGQFMLGTDQGVVLAFDRAAEKPKAKYSCGGGPILSVERNAYFPQLFAACDALCVKLWSETAADYPILDIVSSDGYFTDITWSPFRSSCMYAAKTTGVLEIWDIPGKNKDPLVKVKVCDDCLFKASSSYSGELIACGSTSGTITLLTIPDYMRRSSDLENDLVKGCIKDCDEIIGGRPRSERCAETAEAEEETVFAFEEFDPPERAEDLAEDYSLTAVDLESAIQSAPEGETDEQDTVKSEEKLVITESKTAVSGEKLPKPDDTSEAAPIAQKSVDEVVPDDSMQKADEDGAAEASGEDDLAKIETGDDSMQVAVEEANDEVRDSSVVKQDEDGAPTGEVEDSASTGVVEDDAITGDVENIEDDSATVGVQEDETKAVLQDGESSGEIEGGVPTSEIEDGASTGGVEDDSTPGEVQEGATSEFEEGATSGEVKESAETGIIEEGATAGEIEENAATSEVEESVTSGEIKDDVTQSKVEDNDSQNEVEGNATQGEVEESATSGEIKEDVTQSKQEDDASPNEVEGNATQDENGDDATKDEAENSATQKEKDDA